ncbi:MAG: aminopeptidase [Salinivirgaceae bacterium]|nr:aminopeptidase [Salinivirgaceae bacterium]
MMKHFFILSLIGLLFSNIAFAQETETEEPEGYKFTMEKNVLCSEVDNQQRAGTCWSYSSMGMVEAEMLRMGKEYINLSEMYVVRKSYEKKAWNYVRMHGHFNFGGGGAINDVFDVIKEHGMLPQEIYTGLNYGTDVHTHGEMDIVLKNYLDGIIENKNRKLSTAWFEGFKGILDAYLGEVPTSFQWEGKEYTPRTFADELVGVNPDDYYYFTSYTHHPFYKTFVLEVPDNWTWAHMYNVPVNELIEMFDYSLTNDYSVVWAADISEKGFSSKNGVAVVPEDDIEEMAGEERLKWETMDKKERNKMLYNFDKPGLEKKITQEMRQEAFDNYETTDDHGMLIAGIAKDQNGTKYYYIKNSWGTEYNDYDGYFYASETFVKYKTMSVAFHKDAIPKDIKKKLGIK